MFENEIKFISDFTFNKVKELGSFITVEKLLSTEIHPSIKKYVVGEINYLIYEDRKKLIENSLFDYSGKEISNYFELIGEEIKKTKKISYEDIKNIILQAVSFNANYVVRPKWSLSKLIFGNNKTVSVNEIKMMLNYSYYYEYINNVFLAYISKKKILNISVTEFELIMNKIDRELFMLHQSKLVDNALFAIADYFSIGGLNKSSVAVDSVENFLKEKNLTELLFKFKRAYSNTAKKKADIEDIRKVLYSTLIIDSTIVEDDTENEIAADDKLFEDPLKENFIADDLIADRDTIEENETGFDLNKENRTEAFKADEESLEVAKVNLNELSPSEKVDEIDSSDKHITEVFESQKPELAKDDVDRDDILDTFTNSQPNEVVVPIEDDSFENTPRSLGEEDVLASLTDEIDKENDNELIILDEKEQEDLLNFYDNELEISIDDDLSASFNKKTEPDIDDIDKPESVASDLEQELIIKDVPDDEVSLDQIDFERDLASNADLGKNNADEIDTEELPAVNNRIEDIFSFLSKKEIDRIIKNLFNSDSEEFANSVEKMSACKSFEEATSILENLFKYARIKPHSRDAASLTNAVAKYFNMEK